uniref:Uncharacterized protein n=1 Tax=Rhodosorus marinus TaxID=101924 RepID=A0A7S3EHF5_9RHOD|mmetsp:Transcript_36598/g.146270  ORF Transcript_36598/g.146270 Transcript_36598/m.146270 type:complete len:243 (+) Transcript_36598:400-1128(+)
MGAGFEREQEVKMECFVGGFGGLERRRTGKRVCVVKAGLRDDLRRVGALTLAAGAMLFVPKGAVASNAGEGLLRDRRAGTELVAAVAPAEILDEKDMRIYENKRQLSNRKMTEYSGAQQELIELDTEWEQLWYIRFLQYAIVICVVPAVGLSAAGLGKLFEAWTKAQEAAEREEEIKLTGTYSSPATVRKENVEEEDKKEDDESSPDDKDEGSEGPSPTDDGGPAPGDDEAREKLEQLFGKS